MKEYKGPLIVVCESDVYLEENSKWLKQIGDGGYVKVKHRLKDCLESGEIKKVYLDNNNDPYVMCKNGRHYCNFPEDFEPAPQIPKISADPEGMPD